MEFPSLVLSCCSCSSSGWSPKDKTERKIDSDTHTHTHTRQKYTAFRISPSGAIIVWRASPFTREEGSGVMPIHDFF